VTGSELISGFRALGLHEGDVVMAHVRLSEVGWVVGGVGTVVQALLEAVGNAGTVCAVTSWEDIPLHIQAWPEAWRRAYLEDLPAFDPEVSAANPSYGRFPERLRTWPGAHRSAHPDNGIAAVGARARWLTAEHSLDDSFGPKSPFARFVACEGRVLLLGAPLETMTLLHHAEAIAKVDSKRGFTYHVPLKAEGRVEWHVLRDIDAEGGPYPYEEVIGTHDSPLAVLAHDALSHGIGSKGLVGSAPSHLFPARELVGFATDWIEDRFAGGERGRRGKGLSMDDLQTRTRESASAFEDFDRPLMSPGERRSRLMSWRRTDLLIDVGANVGQYAERARRGGYIGPIVSFEPLAGPYAELADRAHADGDWQCWRLALGRTDGSIELNVSADLVSSSVLPLASRHLKVTPDSRYTHQEIVNMVRLDSMIARSVKAAARPYLKVDVQGFELDVLAGSERLLSRIDAVEVEVSFVALYEGSPLVRDLIEYLHGGGFELRSLEGHGEDSDTGEMVQADAIFLRG